MNSRKTLVTLLLVSEGVEIDKFSIVHCGKINDKDLTRYVEGLILVYLSTLDLALSIKLLFPVKILTNSESFTVVVCPILLTLSFIISFTLTFIFFI